MGEQAEQTSGAAGVQTARGSVRDVLAALLNLEHLLRSTRVGPKALSRVVREVRPSCQAVGDVFVRLVDELAVRFPDPDRIRPLGAFARQRAQQIDDALVRAGATDMGARARLSLESEVHVLRAELDAVRELVDLLDAASALSATELDVDALVAHALAVRAPSDMRRADTVRVRVQPCVPCGAVINDPRVIMPLVAIAVALAARRAPKGVQVTAVADGSDTLVRFAPAQQADAVSVVCAPPRVIAHTFELAKLAASQAGLVLSMDNDDTTAQLRIPPRAVSQTTVRVPASLHEVSHS